MLSLLGRDLGYALLVRERLGVALRVRERLVVALRVRERLRLLSVLGRDLGLGGESVLASSSCLSV